MKPKSVSKHIPLKRLKAIKQDNAIGESGTEYNETELAERIIELSDIKAKAAPITFPPIMPKLKTMLVVKADYKPKIYKRRDVDFTACKITSSNLFQSILDISDDTISNDDSTPSESDLALSKQIFNFKIKLG